MPSRASSSLRRSAEAEEGGRFIAIFSSGGMKAALYSEAVQERPPGNPPTGGAVPSSQPVTTPRAPAVTHSEAGQTGRHVAQSPHVPLPPESSPKLKIA